MSNALQAAADRAPTPCLACGTTVEDGRKPSGYGKTHCADCATEIERRHTWHLNRGGLQ